MNHEAVNLEICVDSVASARAAQAGGATRVELCSALREGGLTPSGGLLRSVREQLKIGVHVMIRPRAGDFLFSEDEFSVMQRDIAFARECGADGVVLGLLTPDGEVDVDRTRRLVALAQPMEVTFHRAIDLVNDIERSLEDVIATGADRILTSGGAPDAQTGRQTLRRMVATAGDRITIMVGGGIRSENAASIAQATGARDFHSGVARAQKSSMRHARRTISLGEPGLSEDVIRVVSESDVRELRLVLGDAFRTQGIH